MRAFLRDTEEELVRSGILHYIFQITSSQIVITILSSLKVTLTLGDHIFIELMMCGSRM